MSALRFRARIAIRGINPYVLVSARRAASLRPQWRKPMPVRVQVNGKPKVPWRINMMPAGDGSFFLYLHGNVRKDANADVGDLVEVSVAFDETYRGGPAALPLWFSRELKRNRRAHEGWKRLSPSRQKEIARYLGQLKSDDAKQRNLRRALDVLAGSAERFMARSWNGNPPPAKK
jgi:uncharacterized protein DUF1905/bacteriocin resistance YdeI/OmpD-like protein